MRAATGSHWSSMSSGVTCALFGWLNTRRTAAFLIICRGFTTQAGRPVRRVTESISTLKFEEGTGELKSGFCSLFPAWRPPLSLVLRARPIHFSQVEYNRRGDDHTL